MVQQIHYIIFIQILYHSSDFLTFKIYTENQQEIIVKKENPIQFGEKKRKLNQLEESIEESNLKTPKIQDKIVILRKYGQKKGGETIKVPDDYDTLLKETSKKLNIQAVRIRRGSAEANIDDIELIKDDVLYFTTEEDEKEFQE